MAKAAKQSFVCQNCGTVTPRWVGKCPGCEEWNTLVEETDAGPPPGTGLSPRGRKGAVIRLETLTGNTEEAPRLPSTGDITSCPFCRMRPEGPLKDSRS